MSTPQPPYPPSTRAKGWRFELDYERIRQSDTWALAAPEIRPWLLMLWMTAWEQVPCGSFPADDELIAARIGMPLEQFQANRSRLLRGWYQATDGRLYHPTVTERVTEMLGYREMERSRKAAWRAAREAERGATPESGGSPEMSHGTDAGQPGDSTVRDATGTGTGTGTGTRTYKSKPPKPVGGGASPSPAPRPKTDPPTAPAAKPEGRTTAIWESYAWAYFQRYGVDPVRNAKVNGQLAQLLGRLGADEAPQVAAFFVDHNNRYYVQKMHAVDCLLADAEKLRTEWATGQRVTAADAVEADRMQRAGDMWTRIIDEQPRRVSNGQP